MFLGGVKDGHPPRRPEPAGVKGWIVALVVASVMAVGLGPASRDVEAFADFELSAYTAAERGSPAVEALLRFVQLVEDRSNGRVQFDFYHGGAFGSDLEALDDLRLRRLDVHLAPIEAYASLYPRIQTLSLPFLFRDENHLLEAIRGPLAQDILKPLEGLGIKGLALWSAGFQHLVSTRGTVGSVDDVADMKVGVSPQGGPGAALWEVLGAEPVVLPWADLGARLRSGDVEGGSGTLYAFHRAGFDEAQQHLSLTGHAWTGYVLAVSHYRWKGLPVSIQQIMQETAQEVGLFFARRWEELHQQSLAAMEQAGVQVEREPDMTGFWERSAEFYRQLPAEAGYDPQLVRRIQALREEGSPAGDRG